MIDPATVFQTKVRQYRRLGYDLIEVDSVARRAKVRVAATGYSRGGFRNLAANGAHDIYRLIEVDATGHVRDERVYN